MRKITPLIPLIALLLASLCGASAAQTPGKTYRIGYIALGGANVPLVKAGLDGLVQGLSKHGYAVGTNLVLETRFADGKQDRLPGLVRELIDAKVEIIMAISQPAAMAAKEATSTIPIVVDGASDPVGTGLVASFSRPGGNITGLSDMAAELSAKRLQLLRDAVPTVKRVAMLYNASDPGMVARYRAAKSAPSKLGIALQPLGVREADDFDTAFAALRKDLPDGIMMVTDALTNLNRKRVFQFAAGHQVPAIFEVAYMVREGGLLSYGPDRAETAERAANILVRILDGANPAELPFEQPTRFYLTVNLKTAKSLKSPSRKRFFSRPTRLSSSRRTWLGTAHDPRRRLRAAVGRHRP